MLTATKKLMSNKELEQAFLKLRTSVKPKQTQEDIFNSTLDLLKQFCNGRTSVPYSVLELLKLPSPWQHQLLKRHIRTKHTDIIEKYESLQAPYIGIVNKFENTNPCILYLACDTNFYNWLYRPFGSAVNPVAPPSPDIPENDSRRIYFKFVESIYNNKVVRTILEDGTVFNFLPPNICEELAKESPELFEQFFKDSHEYLKTIGYKAAKKKVSKLIMKCLLELNRIKPYEINRWTHFRVGERWVEITYDYD